MDNQLNINYLKQFVQHHQEQEYIIQKVVEQSGNTIKMQPI